MASSSKRNKDGAVSPGGTPDQSGSKSGRVVDSVQETVSRGVTETEVALKVETAEKVSSEKDSGEVSIVPGEPDPVETPKIQNVDYRTVVPKRVIDTLNYAPEGWTVKVKSKEYFEAIRDSLAKNNPNGLKVVHAPKLGHHSIACQ